MKVVQEKISEDLKTIKENHLAHIQASMTVLETNYVWVKWLLALLLTSAIGIVVEQFWKIISQ